MLVVTGFLGAGKTTLVRHLLRRPDMADTAVVVNELGAVGLDHRLVRQVADRTVLLAGGCLCCARRDDLVEALRALLDADEAADEGAPEAAGAPGAEAAAHSGEVRRVVIETSGLADPGPIVNALLADPVLQHHFSLDGVVTAVDAAGALAHLERHAESVRQVAAADWLVLTKLDLAEQRVAEALRRRLAVLNPSAPILEATFGQLDEASWPGPRSGLDSGPRLRRQVESTSTATRAHGGTVRALSVELDEPLDWSVFAVWLSLLLHAHGEHVLRFKALVDTGEGGPVALNGVGHVVYPPEHLARWDGQRRSQLVFVLDTLAPHDVSTSLRRFEERLRRPARSLDQGRL